MLHGVEEKREGLTLYPVACAGRVLKHNTAPSEIWTDGKSFFSGVLSCLLADDSSRGPFEYDVFHV